MKKSENKGKSIGLKIKKCNFIRFNQKQEETRRKNYL
jgi:hypothetical protein